MLLWDRRRALIEAVPDPPPAAILRELHDRLSLRELTRAVKAVEVGSLHDAAVGLARVFLHAEDLLLERAEADGFNLFGDVALARARHAANREILFEHPIVPARLVPFFISLCNSDALDPYLAPIFTEVALRLPDWRAMTMTLTTWPNLAWGDWQIMRDAGRARQ
jgi:hypothetical protein